MVFLPGKKAGFAAPFSGSSTAPQYRDRRRRVDPDSPAIGHFLGCGDGVAHRSPGRLERGIGLGQHDSHVVVTLSRPRWHFQAPQPAVDDRRSPHLGAARDSAG
jgi:hypothetical protein